MCLRRSTETEPPHPTARRRAPFVQLIARCDRPPAPPPPTCGRARCARGPPSLSGGHATARRTRCSGSARSTPRTPSPSRPLPRLRPTRVPPLHLRGQARRCSAARRLSCPGSSPERAARLGGDALGRTFPELSLNFSLSESSRRRRRRRGAQATGWCCGWRRRCCCNAVTTCLRAPATRHTPGSEGPFVAMPFDTRLSHPSQASCTTSSCPTRGSGCPRRSRPGSSATRCSTSGAPSPARVLYAPDGIVASRACF